MVNYLYDSSMLKSVRILQYQQSNRHCDAKLHALYLLILQASHSTPLETVYIGCPKQALVLARSGDHGDYENIFFRKIVLVL